MASQTLMAAATHWPVLVPDRIYGKCVFTSLQNLMRTVESEGLNRSFAILIRWGGQHPA